MNFDILKSGYFIVYKTQNSFVQKQIVKAQKEEGFSEEDSQFVHVEPSISGRYSINASIPFSKVIDIVKVHGGRYIKIVKLREPDYEERRHQVALWCATRTNIPYGIFGIFWFKLKKMFKKNFFSAFGDFCSELSAYGVWREYAYEDTAPKSIIHALAYLPMLPNETMPADFLNKDHFEVIWEGYLPKE